MKNDIAGVYQLKNKVTGKIYIGASTRMRKRKSEHFSSMKAGYHKNDQIQQDFNLYGIESFEWTILEQTKKLKEREQHYINTLSNLYNIQSIVDQIWSIPKEYKERRVERQKVFYQEAAEWYYKLKDGSLKMEAIPEKYHLVVKSMANNVPWNKGKKMENTDHLKVPKTSSAKTIEMYKQQSKALRESLPGVLVFRGDKFIGRWESSKDLEDWSLSDQNTLPNFSRNKVSKQGIPIRKLVSGNVNKAARTSKPYKGLLFKFDNALAVSNDCNAEGENGGSPPSKDNPVPSFTEMC